MQKVIDENNIVVFPDFPLLVNKVGLIVKSNKTIIFEKNSKIKFSIHAAGKSWDVIKIYNASNVKIINANIEGSKKSKLEQSGEWSAVYAPQF